MGKKLLIENSTIITLDAANRIFPGSVAIDDGIIVAIEPATEGRIDGRFDEIIDGRGRLLLPGFIQTHIHLCQTLFRGSADDLTLIDWLKQRIWPMEAAHTPQSLYASARLGIAEMIMGGTTCALTMETVNHTDVVFRAVEETGFRATVGKCMMDFGEDMPEALTEKTEESIAESIRLLDRWHGRANGRIRYCFAPRFALSCTRGLLERVASLARERGVIVHSHASENRDEIAMVERATGKRNIDYFSDVGLTAPHVVLAHCVWLEDEEMKILSETGTHVSHCPSSNLKLASGIAKIGEMIERGISVSLGADGAPCNNRLDMFTEMRTSALLQKVLCGAQTIPALTALRLATINGARALGLEGRIGSIETGKRADIQLINIANPHCEPHYDPISTVVYSAQSSDVETVIIDGKVVMRDRELTTLKIDEILTMANTESVRLLERIQAGK